MKYEEIRKQLKTGDIVLFSGKGIISSLIRWFSKSNWSHIGMVVQSTELDAVLLWESTTMSKMKDLDTGVVRHGVQLVLLSERIKNYNGKIGIRQLVTNKVIRTEPLKALRKELRGRPYEKSKLEMFRSVYDGFLGRNKENLSSVFCVEIVSEGLKRIGFLDKDKPSNEYTLRDYEGYMELISAMFSNIIEVEK